MKIDTLVEQGENLRSDSPQLQMGDSIYIAVKMFAMAIDSHYLPVYEKSVYKGRLYQYRITQAVVQAYSKELSARFEIGKQITRDAVKIKNLLKNAFPIDDCHELYGLIDQIIAKNR